MNCQLHLRNLTNPIGIWLDNLLKAPDGISIKENPRLLEILFAYKKGFLEIEAVRQGKTTFQLATEAHIGLLKVLSETSDNPSHYQFWLKRLERRLSLLESGKTQEEILALEREEDEEAREKARQTPPSPRPQRPRFQVEQIRRELLKLRVI
jgi:hypothetical protein